MTMARIGLLDCNNFFVSCERLFRPDLAKCPVVVLSSNDGCIVARSQEVKDMHIPMGVPYFQVKDSLTKAGAAVFSSHFALYRDISRRVFEVVRAELGKVEEYSIDECFFNLTAKDEAALAQSIRQRVWQCVGMPVSVGVAASKTQAKYANAVAKKTTGFYSLPHAVWEETIVRLPLTEIWGVGRGRSQQFTAHGLKTVADYLTVPRPVIARLFGLEGVRLYEELCGHSVLPVLTTQALAQSIMSTRSFAEVVTSQYQLQDALLYHMHEVVAELQAKQLQASAIRVIMYPSRYSDYALQGTSKETIFTLPTNDIFTIERAVLARVMADYKPNFPYKKAGIVVTGLRPASVATGSLFAAEETTSESLQETLLELQKRYRKNIIQLGRLPTIQAPWQAKHDELSPNYTTRWNELKTIKAG